MNTTCRKNCPTWGMPVGWIPEKIIRGDIDFVETFRGDWREVGIGNLGGRWTRRITQGASASVGAHPLILTYHTPTGECGRLGRWHDARHTSIRWLCAFPTLTSPLDIIAGRASACSPPPAALLGRAAQAQPDPRCSSHMLSC
jgi:hypothetical protein